MNGFDIFLWVTVSAIWGSAFLFLEFALEDMPPLTVATLRFVIGSACLLAYSGICLAKNWLSAKEFTDRMNVKDLSILTLLAVINTVIPVATVSYGEFLVNDFTASIFSAATPVVLQMIRVAAQEPSDVPYTTLYSGIAVALLGLIVAFAQDVQDSSGSQVTTSIGCVLLLMSASSYASAAYVARQYAKHIHPTVAATSQVTIGALIAVVLFLPYDAVFPPDGMGKGLSFLGSAGFLSWFGVVYQGVLSAFIGFLIYFFLIPRIGSARMTAVWMTFPVYGVIESAMFLGSWEGQNTRYKFLQCFGSFLVMTGLFILLGGADNLKAWIFHTRSARKETIDNGICIVENPVGSTRSSSSFRNTNESA
jgi:drug/metabolite transporter (DMT)-like permease